jgi:SNF2 family DNA or RNA helicase
MTNRPPYQPRTDVPYFEHQRIFQPQIRELDYAALFWKTGTGKTRSDLEDTAWQYSQDKIDTCLIIAPAEVHRRTWVEQQGPRWLNIPGARLLAFQSKSSSSQDTWREQLDMLEYPGFKLIAMYFEAISSQSGFEYFKDVLKHGGRVKVGIDESHRIMSPGSVVSTRLRKACRDVAIRRIMTATPTGNGLENLYSQFDFLSPSILDVSTYAEYKAMFVHEILVEGTKFKKITGYRNVKYLNKRIAPYTFVAKKPEGMPKQHFVTVPTTLSEEQWKHYHEMKSDYQTQLRNGHWVDGELGIVRLKRLQQIVAGHLPIPDPQNERKNRQVLPLDCPRVTDAIEIVKGCPEKVILWAQEHYEIERIFAALKLAGIGAVMYYGKVKKGIQRDHNIDQFEEDPNTKVLVANDAVGGTGLTIVGKVAPVMDQIFYSHTWSRLLREQCEGRNHREDIKAFGVEQCTYHDLIAYGTTDLRIRRRVQLKNDIAALVENPTEVAKLLDEDLDYVIDGTPVNV